MGKRSIALSFVAACALCALVAVAFVALVREPPTLALWAITLLLSYLVSRYQRRTGPGYDIPASCEIAGGTVEAALPTSYSGDDDCPVRLRSTAGLAAPVLAYRRYPTGDDWTCVPFALVGDRWVASIPRQPVAGKVEYHIEIEAGGERCVLPRRDNVIVRFRGRVGAGVLLPHVLLVLAGMVLSVRAGLETWYGGPAQASLAYITLFALFAGGMVFGPLVQKGAFGKYWTGIPFGHDLTDNKMLISVAAWTAAVVATAMLAEGASAWRLAASGVTLVAFLIPHSLFGSELRYEE